VPLRHLRRVRQRQVPRPLPARRRRPRDRQPVRVFRRPPHAALGCPRRVLLHARAQVLVQFGVSICSVDNQQHKRNTTNHHGKAVDLDIALAPNESKRDDRDKCDAVRGKLVELSDAQIGCGAKNRKSLEPSDIAPTWVHYDVREYEPKYLRDEFFCRDLAGLNKAMPIAV